MDGLAKVVHKIKNEFGVEYVYCWHALLGYWGGIHPDAGQRLQVRVGDEVSRTRQAC